MTRNLRQRWGRTCLAFLAGASLVAVAEAREPASHPRLHDDSAAVG